MNEILYEKIEKYISGEMNSEERAGFEKEMSENGELRSYFSLFQIIETEMQDYNEDRDGEAELKSSLEKLNEKYFSQSQNPSIAETGPYLQERDSIRRIAIWKKLAVAASIIGIIALSATLFFQREKPGPLATNSTNGSDQSHNSSTDISSGNNLKVNDSDSKTLNDAVHELSKDVLNFLFKRNFNMDAVPEDEESPLSDAFEIINNRDYAGAITAIDDAATFTTRGSQPDSALTAFYASYYKALCYMETDKISKAIPELMLAVANTYADSLRLKAQWYLSLAYLKAGDLHKTDSLLKIVAANTVKPSYKLKAERLSNELKRGDSLR